MGGLWLVLVVMVSSRFLRGRCRSQSSVNRFKRTGERCSEQFVLRDAIEF
jgi:hypothetical protein